MNVLKTLRRMVTPPHHAKVIDLKKLTRRNPSPPQTRDQFQPAIPRSGVPANAPVPPQRELPPLPQAQNVTDNADRVVKDLYRSLLLREPDEGGLAGYTDLLKQGQLARVVGGIIRSPEFAEKQHTPEELSKTLYNVFLKRDPDPEGDVGTRQAIATGNGAARVFDIIQSPEYAEVLNRPEVVAPTFTKRTGAVHVDGKQFADDAGKFNGLGATFMDAAWLYQNDRPKLEAQLQALAEGGFTHFRALGAVGNPDKADFWDGKEINPNDPAYKETIAGLTDLAYDKYGLRVQWTLIGSGEMAPSEADRTRLVDTFLEMSKGREAKIMHFEIANEAWQNGFGGDQGTEQLRRLTKYMNDRTDIPVAASAPPSNDDAEVEAYYKGNIADLATIHFDRDTSKADGPWRPVRQPWEYQFHSGVPAMATSNEPIGPGSSVNTENDPKRLVAAALASYVSGVGSYTFHSKAGVRNDVDLRDMPGIDAFKNLNKFVPADLASWSPKNGHWADSPFKPYIKLPNGSLKEGMWPDEGGAQGAVRVYSGVKGNEFFSFPFGIKGELVMEPRRPAEVDVINPMTGEVVEHKQLNAGEKFTLSGDDMFVLKGRYL